MYGMIEADFKLDPRDLKPYTLSAAARSSAKLQYRSVCLGSLHPWDVKRRSQIIQEELGWKGDEVEGVPPRDYPYEKIECYMQGVRDYLKFLKRGYIARRPSCRPSTFATAGCARKRADNAGRGVRGQPPAEPRPVPRVSRVTEAEFLEIAISRRSRPRHRPGSTTTDGCEDA